ncbi:MAPEG family protein [Variovorax sp. PCZ-1]|uniref:MAPEG family protein n=1 Tax=Variovorax sp. PCZ-1 TaxID=2835533 RepID=UPI001BD15105|nr:MAPEG family protein [Variovorax sp. PCZ-1]MBS7807364.1 MAPEG family protein [Variovorax sp. PCZ-1]
MSYRFTVAYWILLFAALLPIACAGIAKWGMFNKSRKEGGFDNHSPRQWLERQQGWRARANAAQANTFEALPFFFAAVIIAHQLGAGQTKLDLLCLSWLMLRIFYVITYVGDMPTPRTAIWVGALVVNILILFAGFR